MTTTTQFAELLSQQLEEFIGQKVAVVCLRYQYWGILTHVGKNFIVLSDAAAVEDSGQCRNDAPNTVDNMQGPATIPLDSIELFYQPNWSQGILPNEKESNL